MMFSFNVLKKHTCFINKIKQNWRNQVSVYQIKKNMQKNDILAKQSHVIKYMQTLLDRLMCKRFRLTHASKKN